MTRFVVTQAATTLFAARFVASTTVRSNWNSKGYSAYASLQWDGCPYIHSSSLDISAYGDVTRFKQTSGGNGEVQTSKYDDFYVSLSKSSCDDATITYQYGYVFDSEDYGDMIEPEFMINKDDLTKATLKGAEVPIYGNTCSYICTEVCYPEIFGHGTCPETESPYLECYTVECSVEEYYGIAQVNVYWKVPKRLVDEGLAKSNSMYRSRQDGNTYMSRSRGQYRYDVPVTVKVTLNGSEMFPSSPTNDYAELGKTRSKQVEKTKYIA
jgi:hypothetical protein